VIVSGATAESPLSLTAKVCVVGSGAGGALVAMRLAEAGHDVLVLEAGSHVPAAKMTQREGEMMPALYYEAGLRASEDASIGILHGRVLGGSTVVNYLDCFRTPDRVLDEWADGHDLPSLRPDRMRPRFERIEELLSVAQISEAQLNANNRKLMLGTRALGWKGDTFHRNANQCYGSGFCDLGCAYNAKQSTAITMLPRATNRGARIVTECRVERVHLTNGRATGVSGSLLGPDRRPRGTFEVKADYVVVSGGSIETPHLLLRSEIPNPSDEIGRNLFLHPSCAVAGWFPGENIASYNGIKQGWYISEFSGGLNGHPIDALIEGIGGPPGIASSIFGGIGAERREGFRHFNEYAVAGVLMRDLVPGRIVAGNGRPKVTWALGGRELGRFRMAVRYAAEAFLAAGAAAAVTSHARPVVMRSRSDLDGLNEDIWGTCQLPIFSFHQMGSCRMGSSPDRDVVDPTGRVWAVDRLYVADASLFPSASGVNPQITVYGLADVVADGILAALPTG
jgi:choline dehydrogenase-like flavoprotein